MTVQASSHGMIQAVPHDVREFSTSSCRTRYGAFIILRKENCRVNLSNDRCK
jgi:hypothetical protein